MPDGRIVINGRVWQGVTRLEMKNKVVMLSLDMVEKLGTHINWDFYPERPVFEPDDGEIMVPVSLLCRYLDLHWTYLPEINTLVLTREEPALRGKRIVLDAGHGGADTGATDGSLVESELNWDITKRLADVLQLSGALIEYTRQNGEQATLSQRLAKVSKLQPDLFISVHHNSFLNELLNGTETYWYGNWEARHLAQYIHTHVLEGLGTINRGVREAAFCVLRYIAATSALIKVGFITGKEDSAVVASPWMRERAALGIFRGVREYIEENPPQM